MLILLFKLNFFIRNKNHSWSAISKELPSELGLGYLTSSPHPSRPCPKTQEQSCSWNLNSTWEFVKTIKMHFLAPTYPDFSSSFCPGKMGWGARLWSVSKSTWLGGHPQIYQTSHTTWGKSLILRMRFLACKMGVKTHVQLQMIIDKYQMREFCKLGGPLKWKVVIILSSSTNFPAN